MRRRLLFALLAGGMAVAGLPAGGTALAQAVPLTALGRFDGWRDNALIGYGLVTGLAGSGDSRRNGVTRQALRNILSRLGTTVTDDQISSRNVAVVMVVATLQPSANVGDRMDAVISSIGDARSLAGGTLLMTPLLGPNQRPYALAQGPLLAGGYSFESQENRQQRNYPTSAVLQGGVTVEQAVEARLLRDDGALGFLLRDPDFATAHRIAQAINARFGAGTAEAVNADEVRIANRAGSAGLTAFVAALEGLAVEPNRVPRVVINERTGTVVAGADVLISSAVIAQGDIKVTITAETLASQPQFIAGFASDVRSLVVTNTTLEVEDDTRDAVVRFPNTTIGDLAQALSRAQVSTRRMISILQALKAAGALHADLVIQ